MVATIGAMNLRYIRRVILILADVVNHAASVDALQPRAGWPVVEEAGVPTVGGEQTATVRALEATTELANGGSSLATRQELDVHVSHIGFVPSCGKRSPISVTQ